MSFLHSRRISTSVSTRKANGIFYPIERVMTPIRLKKRLNFFLLNMECDL